MDLWLQEPQESSDTWGEIPPTRIEYKLSQLNIPTRIFFIDSLIPFCQVKDIAAAKSYRYPPACVVKTFQFYLVYFQIGKLRLRLSCCNSSIRFPLKPFHVPIQNRNSPDMPAHRTIFALRIHLYTSLTLSFLIVHKHISVFFPIFCSSKTFTPAVLFFLSRLPLEPAH